MIKKNSGQSGDNHLKILMISSNFPPAIGGPASTTPFLARELAKHGHDVYIATQSYKDYPFFKKEDKVRIYRSPAIFTSKHYRAKEALVRSLSIGILSSYLLRKKNIDIIHAHDMNVSAVAGFIAKKSFKRPSLVKYAGDLVWEYMSLVEGDSRINIREMWNKHDFRTMLVRRLQYFLINNYDFIAAQTDYHRNLLLKLGVDKDKIILIPNAIDLSKFKIENRLGDNPRNNFYPNSKIVLTACRLVPWKGVDQLIRAASYVIKEDPSVNFLIVGEGAYKSYLNKLIEKLNVLDNVFILGKKPYNEIPRFLHLSDVFVLASTYEPFGLALLEAMACGKPVIATKVGGIPEIIKDNETGILIKPHNPKMLGKVILSLLSDEKLRKRLGDKARSHTQNFDWSKVIHDYINAYEMIIELSS